MYLDTFMNKVSRYVTVSRYIWNVTYLDTFQNLSPPGLDTECFISSIIINKLNH